VLISQIIVLVVSDMVLPIFCSQLSIKNWSIKCESLQHNWVAGDKHSCKWQHSIQLNASVLKISLTPMCKNGESRHQKYL